MESETTDWARNADPLFTFLGIYVATFQWIEGELDQIILMGAGFENWEPTQDRLARMDNAAKVDAAMSVAANAAIFPLVATVEGWLDRLRETAAKLHGERRRRNEILHAQFLMEGVEHGLPAIRSVRRRGGSSGFSQEELSRRRMDAILDEIARLSLDVGMIAVQLRQAVPRR